MRRSRFGLLVRGLAVLLLVGAPATVAKAETARERVIRNLEELHVWLETSPYAEGWKTYLRSPELEAQLARSESFDRQALKDILARYSAERKGLDKRRFAAVRRALEVWVDELNQPAPAALARLAREATQRFEPPTRGQQAERRQSLQAAVARLDRFLARGGAETYKGWRKYLDLPELQKQLASDAAPDARTLRRIELKFFALHAGLELPVFDAVRQRLRSYTNTLIVADPRARGYYEGQLNKLAAHFDDLNEAAKSETLIEVGRILGVLEMGGQARPLVEQARHLFGRPNLHVQISEHFLAAGMNEKIRAQESVSETIMGTRVYTRPDLRAELTVDLVPDDTRASFDIRLSGAATSKSVGYNGPVAVYTDGYTTVEGRKQIFLDGEGFGSEPAQARCDTKTVINAVAARLRLVQRIGWRQAGRHKSTAEHIASRRAEQRVRDQIDTRAAEMLAKLNKTFKERFVWPLTRKDHLPRAMRFRSSEDWLLITLLQAGTYQLGAPDDPPAAEPDLDIAIRVHESYVGNLSEGLIGGETLTDVRLADLMEELTGEVPEQLQLKEENEPWSITFAGTRPIRVRFDDQQARIAVVGARFTRGDQPVNEPIEIAASYSITKTPQGAKFVRQGEVEINFLAAETLSVGQVAFKKFMQTKFDAVFKPEVVGKGMELEGRWERAGRLHLQQLSCDDGWVAFGWTAPGPDARIARKPKPTVAPPQR